jgi:hypothetical protein
MALADMALARTGLQTFVEIDLPDPRGQIECGIGSSHAFCH